jgi:UDP-glucose 4-epimerase
MKVVVTGGSGQLGVLVLRRLVNDRSVQAVRCVDLRPPTIAGGKLEYVSADVRESSIGERLRGFDALVHLAFVVDQDDVGRARSVNVHGSRNVFLAAGAQGIRKLVYSSSLAAYGVVYGHALPIVEDASRMHQPDFTYAATRYDVESFLDKFEAEHPEIQVVRLRPSILIGAHLEHSLGLAIRKRLLFDAGGGPMPVVWDEDVADAVMLALKKDVRGAFNLSADQPLPPREIARVAGMRHIQISRPVAFGLAHAGPLVERITGQPATHPFWTRIAQVPMTASSERARTVLEWNPSAPTAEDVWKRFAREVPQWTNRRILLFFAFVNAASFRRGNPDLQGFSTRAHLALTGEGGGDYTLEVRDERLRVRAGIPRPPTATLTLPASLLLELLAGKTDFSSVQITGRLRVEGEGHAALLLAGMIAAFRNAVRGTGPLPLRWLGRWIARDSAR